jgi:alkylation response protein AidB-like acyl-CoA dehydrogenase
MIDFDAGDELELVRATAADFASDQLRPAMREQESARKVSDAARAAYEEIGLSTLAWPEGLGGSGLGALAHAIVLEELAAGDPGAALALDPLGPSLYPLLEFGGEAALAEFGVPLLEQAGARALLVWNGRGTRARLQRDGDFLSGSIPWVPSDRVDLLVVLDDEGAVVVRDGTQTISLRGAGLRTAGASEVALAKAPLCAQWHDRAAARRCLARARLYQTAMLIGVMREAADYSRNYALDRVAFGKPIAHHQALAFLIVDMATAVDSARLLCHEAAWRLDGGLDAEEACATAFVEAVEAAGFVTPNAVQILGGHGFMLDHPVEKFMRDARSLGLVLGGVDLAREEAGRELSGTAGPVALGVETA